MDSLSVLLMILVILFLIKELDPKLDYNYETGHRVLWYNDILSGFTRKFIKLWRTDK